MKFFLDYFTPALCVLIFSLIPIYFIRIIFFIRRKHFIDELTSLNLSLYIHIFLYAVFVINLFFYTVYIDTLVLYIFGFAMIAFLVILMGYRRKFAYVKRNRFVVLFSKPNNREDFQTFLNESNLKNVDIGDGSFSFVTRIKFNNATIEEIDDDLELIDKQKNLIFGFNSLKGLLLFAGNTAMFFGSVVAFVIFFVYIPRLGF